MKKRVMSSIVVLTLLIGAACCFIVRADAAQVNCSGAVGEMTYQCKSGQDKFCSWQQVNGEMTICTGEIIWKGTPTIIE